MHSQISRTLSLATQVLEKKNWKEIKTNQKWSLEKDVLHVHVLFLQVSCTHQPAYHLLTFKTEHTKTLTYNLAL